MSAFGPQVDAIWPPIDAKAQPISHFGRQLLEQCQSVSRPRPEANVDVAAFMEASADFPLQFGVNSCRVVSQPEARHECIGRQIASTYPVIHERTLALYLQYLEHKSEWGNDVEKRVYRQLTLCDFVQRLLAKRAVSFFARDDKYLLLSGKRGAGGFEAIGTPEEQQPLVLEQLLSYDDIKLSALLSVSSHTEFINEGERSNCGRVPLNRYTLEPEGVIMGLIGARLSRPNVMEYQDIVIAGTQNTPQHGYGRAPDEPVNTRRDSYRRLWCSFYETCDQLSSVRVDSKRFGTTKNKVHTFDNLVMKRRYAISFDMLLLEAQARAVAAGRLAYVHVVGFGLGVWNVAPQQEHIFLETFEQRLRVLSARLSHIGVVHFSWFKMKRCGGLHDGAVIEVANHTERGIRVHLSKRNPADKLSAPEHENMLLVVSYAWDGNALPGNEFWMNKLKSTGDSSTACSTLITELHNPHINTEYCNGRNLHIASPKHGVLHISEYAKILLEQKA